MRLKFLMQDVDSYLGIKMDRYEYAEEVARENGREYPNIDDEFTGFIRMVDDAIEYNEGK